MAEQRSLKKPDMVCDTPASIPYPTNLSAPKFDLVPIKDVKDKAKNIAIHHANEKISELQEQYDLIMKQAELVQKQAKKIVDRMTLTDRVIDAEYQFVPVPYKVYWLCYDSKLEKERLVTLGPNDWCTGAPDNWMYDCCVRLLGDSTWERVE